MHFHHDVKHSVRLADLEKSQKGIYDALEGWLKSSGLFHRERLISLADVERMRSRILCTFPKCNRTDEGLAQVDEYLRKTCVSQPGIEESDRLFHSRRLSGNIPRVSIGFNLTSIVVAEAYKWAVVRVDKVTPLDDVYLKFSLVGVDGWAAGGRWDMHRRRRRTAGMLRLAGLMGRYDKIRPSATRLSGCYLLIQGEAGEEDQLDLSIKEMGANSTLVRRNKLLDKARHAECPLGMPGPCWYCTKDQTQCVRSVWPVSPDIGICAACGEAQPVLKVKDVLVCAPCIGVAFGEVKRRRNNVRKT